MEDKPMTREQIKKLIQEGVTELHEALQNGRSETLERYLEMLSRFHHYSFNNVMLIAIQRPSATHVAGFHAWKHLGRSVKKGERGIGIIAPMICRKKADQEDDETIRGFTVVHVFDVSQTEGGELPEFAEISGTPGDNLLRLESLVRQNGIELEYDYIPNGADGMSSKGTIVVRPGLSEAETFAVLAHELAHELLHQRTGRTRATSRKTRETEAEAVAHVVCRAVGMDSTTRVSDYIQLYRGDADTLSECLDHIQKAAAVILDGITNSPSRRRAKAA
jgi:hypothetical protein